MWGDRKEKVANRFVIIDDDDVKQRTVESGGKKVNAKNFYCTDTDNDNMKKNNVKSSDSKDRATNFCFIEIDNHDVKRSSIESGGSKKRAVNLLVGIDNEDFNPE